MKSTVDNYEKKNTINNSPHEGKAAGCREQKSTRREGGGVNLRTGKLKRIKTQAMSRHPWYSGKRAALE